MVKDAAIQKSNKDIGKAVLAQAQSAYNTDRTNAVADIVKGILRNRELALYWEETNRMAAAFFDKKLKALEAGQFSIQPANGAIIFHDKALWGENYRREDEIGTEAPGAREMRLKFIRDNFSS